MEKSALMGINYSEEEVDSLASEIGCKEEWPIKYLGVTVRPSVPSVKRQHKLSSHSGFPSQMITTQGSYQG